MCHLRDDALLLISWRFVDIFLYLRSIVTFLIDWIYHWNALTRRISGWDRLLLFILKNWLKCRKRVDISNKNVAKWLRTALPEPLQSTWSRCELLIWIQLVWMPSARTLLLITPWNCVMASIDLRWNCENSVILVLLSVEEILSQWNAIGWWSCLVRKAWSLYMTVHSWKDL